MAKSDIDIAFAIASAYPLPRQILSTMSFPTGLFDFNVINLLEDNTPTGIGGGVDDLLKAVDAGIDGSVVQDLPLLVAP